jgi:hypothetical protein
LRLISVTKVLLTKINHCVNHATTRMNQQPRSFAEETNNRMLSAGLEMRLMEIFLLNGEAQIPGAVTTKPRVISRV